MTRSLDPAMAGAIANVVHAFPGAWMVDDMDTEDTEAIGGEAGEPQGAAPAFFGERGGVVASRLGEAIRSAGHLRVGIDGRLYRYADGVYRADGDAFVRARTRELLGDRWQRRNADDVGAWLRSFEATIDDEPPEHLLNVANGLLDWRAGTMQPHDPEIASCVQLPVRWDPEATCPRFERFLGEVLPADARELLFEILGMAVYARNSLRRAALLSGSGCNGKSTLLHVGRALVGPVNCAAVPLQSLAENRYAAAELFGKLANIAGDLDARAIRRTDVFKTITGGDVLHAERKYGHPFSFRPFALLMFAANEPPISSDQSDAWFDRWIVLPFDRRISEENIDPNLGRTLTTPAELSGILALAVDGLRRVTERGRYAQVESVARAGGEYRDRLDTVRGFVADACVLRPDAWTPRPTLYRSYKQWCIDTGRLPVSAETFNGHLRQNHGDRLEQKVHRGQRGWSGIGLLSEDREP